MIKINWYKCVTTSIFRIYLVGAWLMYGGCTQYFMHPNPETDRQEFYYTLEKELTENNRKKIQRSIKERLDDTEYNTFNYVP